MAGTAGLVVPASLNRIVESPPDEKYSAMMNHLTRYGAAIVLLALLVVAGSGQAQTSVETLALLRSAGGHGGSNVWTMCRQEKVAASGAAISVTGFSAEGWQPAIVPGTVLNSLVANGVYPEPYFGLNNAHEQKLIPDISEAGREFYTYWFRTEFFVPDTFAERQVWLQFDGINYRAEIWVNGTCLGNLAGMFQRGRFNATEFVRCGTTNVLAVLVKPVDLPGGFRAKNKVVRAAGENKNGGDGEIGRNTTMLMTVGWDFTFTDGIRDRNTGIWRDVKLFATGPVALGNLFVKSELPMPALAPARETISVEVLNATDQPQSGVLVAAVKAAGIRIEKELSLQPGETREVALTPEDYRALTIAKPRLWWPMNKGEQHLYDLKLEFKQGRAVSDRVETRFGIRDIRSNRETPDKSRQFLVNGRRYFLHGSNWIPEAMCRTSRERTAAELRYTRQAGINFLRLWGGGIAESDDFYDLCDELGILVWTEFWQAGDTLIPDDHELYRANVADTLKRLRNHPSQAYYVSANERDEKGIVPIADLVEKLDGTRGYQAGSEMDGIHDGSPYVAENPMLYYSDTASKRGSRINGLCPEYGCPILPTVDSLREMMSEKDLWPINQTVWDYLDGGGFHGMTKNYDRCVQQYGPSASIEEYATKAQAFGGLAWRAIWECWTANKFDYGDRFCSGLLFWYHNSPNRQVCGRMWDWSLEPTAALYFTQDAHEPLHAQFDFLSNTVSVNNEFPREFKGRVTARVLDFDMVEVFRKTVAVNVGSEAVTNKLMTVAFPQPITPVHFIKLDLEDAGGRPVSDTFYWRSDNAYKPGRSWTGPQFDGFEDLSKLPKIALSSKAVWSRAAGENVCTVTVKNPSKSLAFQVWLRLQHTGNSKPVRPAFYDDNFFSLLPGENRTVRIAFNERVAKQGEVHLLVDGWNVTPLIHRAPTR
jgi:mannosylglycoprotein endo-beta-mannosidase